MRLIGSRVLTVIEETDHPAIYRLYRAKGKNTYIIAGIRDIEYKSYRHALKAYNTKYK